MRVCITRPQHKGGAEELEMFLLQTYPIPPCPCPDLLGPHPAPALAPKQATPAPPPAPPAPAPTRLNLPGPQPALPLTPTFGVSQHHSLMDTVDEDGSRGRLPRTARFRGGSVSG